MGRVIADVRRVLPQEGLVFTSAGNIQAQVFQEMAFSLPRTYIRLKRDRSVTWEQQAHAISLLPGLAVREIDAPHQAMVTHPVELAAILNELAGG